MGREFVGPAMLRQMRGRAGRQGKCPVGETYLCCRENDLEQVVDLMKADLPQVYSCLNAENRRIQRYLKPQVLRKQHETDFGSAILEVISTRLANSYDSIRFYFSRSLLAYTQDSATIDRYLESGLRELEQMGLIEYDDYANHTATQLGNAIVASAIDPDDGVFVHSELVKTLRAFVMDGEMHVLYILTPVQDFGVSVNWQVFRNEMDTLDESGMRVLRFLGIKPTAILKL